MCIRDSNIPEAEILTGIEITNKNDMILAANEFLKLGVPNVLVKGGHLKSKKVKDIFPSAYMLTKT